MQTGGKRRTTDITGIDVQINVMHAGIAHQGHIQDILAFDTGAFGHLGDDIVQAVDNGLV